MPEKKVRREVHRRKVHEDVAEYLLEDISNGVYKVGEELPSERALMDEFGVGRPAIRESLAKLARMGLVEVRPGSRSRVCRATIAPLLGELDGTIKMTLMTPSGERNMQEIRIMFETAVGRLIVDKMTAEHRQKMQDILTRSRDVLDDAARFADLDIAFHRVLGEATGNPMVVALYDAFGKWLLNHRLTSFQNPARPALALRSHEQIFAALQENDPDGVAMAIRQHLNDANASYWSVLEQKNRTLAMSEAAQAGPEE